MSKRTPARTASTPALVSNATPTGTVPVPGGVVSADTPTTPAVPSTEPLPSDQATAAPRPVAGDGTIVTTPADIDRLLGDRPSIVPETPPALDLIAPADPATEVAGKVIMERVPGTTPLPADQITPVAPVLVPDAMGLAASLSLMSDGDRAAMREWLGVGAPADVHFGANPTGADDPFAGIRLFPVAYDVDRDGRTYTPGGQPIKLNFAEYQHFVRATAVTLDWLKGEVVEA